jgi:hypothetical protein
MRDLYIGKEKVEKFKHLEVIVKEIKRLIESASGKVKELEKVIEPIFS